MTKIDSDQFDKYTRLKFTPHFCHNGSDNIYSTVIN